MRPGVPRFFDQERLVSEPGKDVRFFDFVWHTNALTLIGLTAMAEGWRFVPKGFLAREVYHDPLNSRISRQMLSRPAIANRSDSQSISAGSNIFPTEHGIIRRLMDGT